MTEETEPEDVPQEEPHDEDEDPDRPLSPEIRSALQAFQQQQRILASFDFSAIANLQRAVSQSGLSQALQAIQKSVNFAAIQDIARAVPQIPRFTPPRLVEPDVVARLASSLDLTAITRANKLIMENAGFLDLTRRQAEQFAAFAVKFDYSALVRQLNTTLAGINWEELRTAFERLLPSNLRSVRDLVTVAELALDEGLPLAWIPRPELLDELVRAPTSEDRIRLLDSHAEEVMDDCEAVLNGIEHEWADQCRSAVRAFRGGLEAPAQSHAGNIIDSIVLAVLGQNGRDHAKTRAREEYEELPIHVAVENLVLRPLFLGFIKWFPGGADPIPDHFARHATAHAVGQPGVFSRHNALVAVMLATSLTVQFWDDPAAP